MGEKGLNWGSKRIKLGKDEGKDGGMMGRVSRKREDKLHCNSLV